MIAKLLRGRRPQPPINPTIPQGQRVYAVGDVHGRIDLLDDLLGMIDADESARGAAHSTLIFLGDLVDRGPASAAVIQRLLDLSRTDRDVRFLMGNHEEIFLGAIEGEPKSLRLFCRIGGRETIQSYGLDAAQYDRMDYEGLKHRLDDLVPRAHREFLAAFEDIIVIGDYAFVHAGVRPDQPLDAQSTGDLRWIRDPFLDHRQPLEKTIVHGHTMSNDIERHPHRIGIDTGAYASGRLTALGLQADLSWSLQTSAKS